MANFGPGFEWSENPWVLRFTRIAAANKAIPYLKPTASVPLPEPWQARFYVRTDSGNLVTKATGRDFRTEEHPLFPLFAAGNELLTEVGSCTLELETGFLCEG